MSLQQVGAEQEESPLQAGEEFPPGPHSRHLDRGPVRPHQLRNVCPVSPQPVVFCSEQPRRRRHGRPHPSLQSRVCTWAPVHLVSRLNVPY